MKRLFLMGSIGCGKSTMIRNALGRDISQAGGFLTVRITDGPKLLGFELVSPRALHQGHRFLDFENGTLQKDRVFTDFGISYLQTPASFAVIDEFGGLELLEDDFYNALLTFLQSDIPCIGVLKTEEAAAAMAEKVPLGPIYFQRYRTLLQTLKNDPETQLIPTTGWQDQSTVEILAQWAEKYIRRRCNGAALISGKN